MKKYMSDLIKEACSWKSLNFKDIVQYKFDGTLLECFCDYCGEYFQIKEIRQRNITNELHYHSKCYRLTESYKNMRIKSAEKNKGEGPCSICGKYNEFRDQNQRGKSHCKCSSNWFLKHNSSDRMVEISTNKLEILNKNPGRLKDLQYGPERICKHGNTFRCFTEDMLINKCKESCFCRKCSCLLKDGQLNILCKDCYSKMVSQNGFVNLFIEDNSCKEHSTQLSYFNKCELRYECWECYKNKFKSNITSLKLNNIISLEMIDLPTFRNQNSEDWSGSRSAFEQYLLENNIKWFVYLKYYINEKSISVPIVVGKTGSRLVNVQTDISFSTDINDGPARRFLFENKLEWDKTKISIIKCENEKEALALEKEIMKKLNLFGS